MLQRIRALALEAGFYQAEYLDIAGVKFYPEVRDCCRENACRGYQRSWACPPAVGTVDECRERMGKFRHMLLFSQKYDLEDSFDFDGMMAGMSDFKRLVDDLHRRIVPCCRDFLLLSNEGCDRCSICTYPSAPCRFPEMLHHSLEGYGLMVYELANQAGIRYNNGPNTVTYFGALCFNEPIEKG